jgi:UDP-2,4-diacetamido-2,4,6-trideoxy-beta-L-altropyranose hydrolase
MKFSIRVDASSQIGTGHFMRCLTLADVLKQRDAQIRFISRHLPGHLRNMLTAKGHQFMPLNGSSSEAISDELPHAHWLGTTQHADAQDTIQALSDQTWDWLVVDHYALDQRWESAMRASVGHIMVIDDLADRHHDCDLLLDQNLVAQMHTRYADKVPPACGLLLGPEYALLQPIYAELHDRIPPREGPIQRILVFFGGADGDNLTGRTLAAFLRLGRPDIEVDVVITADSPHTEVIRQQAVGHGNIHLHSGLPTLAPLMTKADLAVGAGGATSWERLCLGLPTLVVTLAENQCPIADGLSQRRLIRWLGNQDAVDESAIAQALDKLVQRGLDNDWSLRCLAAVDGNGINRVRAALTVTEETPLQARHARLADEALFLEWANDPTTRRNAFSPEPISAATHRSWFRDHMRNLEGCHLYIVETTDGVPLGQVRFERSGQAWEVHYSLAPIFRGRGLGRPLLDMAMQKLRAADMRGAVIFGQVTAGNQPSRKVFEALGFETQPDVRGGVTVYQRTL